jgi:hypothetical protein
MLPSSNFSNIFYPMTAEVYYAQSRQDDLGVPKKTWIFDRVIKCSVISTAADRSTLTAELKQTNAYFELNSDAIFRTNHNIQKKKNGTFMPITEILITNIKDPKGTLVWETVLNKSVQFEVKSFISGYESSHNVKYYRAYIARSKKQYEVVY